MQQPPGGIPGRLPVDLRPRRSILLPYNDLLIDQGLDQFLPILPGGFQLGIVLPYAMGPTEPKVLQTDAAGNLAVTLVGGSATSKVQLTTAGGDIVSNLGNSDAVPAGFPGLWTGAQEYVFNGAAWDRSRAATAADLVLQPTKGVKLVASPGEWSAFNNGALGAASSASQAAGAAGVRHVLVGYSVIISSQVAPLAGAVTINIRDGASGGGIVLEALTVQIPAALYQPILLQRSGLSMVGSAATAMTVEQSAAYAAVATSINFEGYDAA